LIEREVAPDVVQERRDDWPEVIDAGVVIKEEMVGAAGGSGVKVVKVKSGDETELPGESTDVTLK